MLTRLTFLVAVLGVLLAPLWGSTASAQTTPDPQALVDRYLQANGARPGTYRIVPITEDYVVDTFPEFAFFEVYFQQYPVGVLVPRPFAASNLFLVVRGQVFFMTDSDQLRLFYLLFTGTIENEGQALDTGRSWLRLTQAFSQDGFYTFGRPNVVVVPAGGGGEGVELRAFILGEVQVTGGGRGQISVLMLLDTDGRLVWVFEERRIVMGPRPICQATKLLDADPIIRGMAEQDLLYLGRKARPYLDEQRAKASPELKEAIDRLWKKIEQQR